MDGMMMGLAGTVIGASAVGVSGMVKSLADSWLPGAMAKTGHKHQMNVNLQSQRHEAVKYWRAGLADARMSTANGRPDRATKMRLMRSVASGSRAYDRTYPAPVKRRYSAQLTKSIAITRLSCCCRSDRPD